jgi:hypothetical protein
MGSFERLQPSTVHASSRTKRGLTGSGTGDSRFLNRDFTNSGIRSMWVLLF